MSAEEKAMAACCGGNVPALRALVQAGVSIDHRTGNTNSTLLHMAAYCGQVDSLKLKVLAVAKFYLTMGTSRTYMPIHLCTRTHTP